ncbi:MAG TPA: hypothetical protein PLJ35_04920 [Anaerolineae bacterium]|nr:hypothetical protein [Anaerolineae bacterium]HOQ98144.1 hypothetical protein [Anaerolineae bacterium]HPL30128.1 hypothetical protein [Anaerolineae bacterium]
MVETDLKAEGRRVVERGEAAGVRLRLLGGVAIALISPRGASHAQLAREYADIDCVGLHRDARQISDLFAALGYEHDQRFNALHGYKRLIFYDEQGRHADIFLDRFEMCHTLDLKGRLLDGYLTLPAVDLLITKLQIVQLNDKDLRDILALLLDHEIEATEGSGKIDAAYLAGLTSADWGLHTTLSDNLARARDEWPNYLNEAEGQVVAARIEALLVAMERAPKTLAWRLRARIGRRVEWYELPDEVAR